MAERTDLKICRDLINPHFDGYKLSLESLPTYSTKINQGIEEITLSDEQYSYHHAKLFGADNHLVLDQWSPTDVYFIDKDWNVMKATAISNSISVGQNVLQIPDSVNQKKNPLRVSLCLHFVSSELAVITDGAGKLHLVSTGNRTDPTSKWKILFSSDVLDDNKPLVLTDAVLHSDNENHFVECLCTHVIESTPEQKEKHRSSFLTIIEWVTLTSVDKISWAVGRTRQLIGRKPFDYAAVDHEGLHIIIAAEALFNFVSDSLKPVIDTEEAENGDSTEIGPEYTWNQTQTVIHAQFTVPPNVTKADVSLATGYDKIDLGLKNGKTLLEGQLFGRIDPNEWDVNLTGQSTTFCQVLWLINFVLKVTEFLFLV
ncbi:hypothetical protein KUTeg_019963 [Tegillarca granosa]|uniref:NudC domain-containing protein 1 n=1 Tax=Tegillarca granosa TaxID=220873 RepID=A0ABQ9EJ28_TEGGR|nr:hypothetical protein KUTeg_019963 [Tegillarca granosa]